MQGEGLQGLSTISKNVWEKGMMHIPLLYCLIYYKMRNNQKGNIVIPKKEFRRKLAQPLGINTRKAEFLFRDLKRYHIIREIGRGRNGKIILNGMENNAWLFDDLIELRKAGLI